MRIQITMIPARGDTGSLRLVLGPLLLSLFILALSAGGVWAAAHYGYLPSVSATAAEPQPLAPEHEALLQEVVRQREQLDILRTAHRQELDTMAARLGKLQGHVWRLESLSSGMLKAVELEGIEFVEEGSPGQGGPGRVPSYPETGASSPEFMHVELQRMARSLQSVGSRLELVRSLSMGRKLIPRVTPGGSPLAEGWYSSHYGMRNNPFTGRREFHGGLDISGSYRSPIHAMAAGMVTWSGRKGGYGNLVEISHGEGYVTRYGHNTRNLVAVGEWVEQGQVIATMGSTGRSTGAHLHFEVEVGGKPVNPIDYITRFADQP